jgi:hypothetical protein
MWIGGKANRNGSSGIPRHATHDSVPDDAANDEKYFLESAFLNSRHSTALAIADMPGPRRQVQTAAIGSILY